METKKGKCEDCFYSTKMDFDDEGGFFSRIMATVDAIYGDGNYKCSLRGRVQGFGTCSSLKPKYDRGHYRPF